MDTNPNLPQPTSGLGDGGATGAGKVRPRKPVGAADGPVADLGTVAAVEADPNGRVEVANSSERPAKWLQDDSIYIRLMKAQGAVRTLDQDADVEIKKEGKTVGKYKGVTAAQIVTNAKSVLLDHGIVYFPQQSKNDVKTFGNKTVLWVDVHFVCCDMPGSSIVMGAWGAGTDNGDKDYAKAFTNAVKQVLSKALGMSTIEDEKDDAVEHQPNHKPEAVRNAEALSDVAIKTWADAYKSAIDGCRTLAQLKKIRAENAHMMTNPGVPDVTRDYFIDKITALEGTLE